MFRYSPILAACLLLIGCGQSDPPEYQAQVSEEDRALGAEQHPMLLSEFGGVYRGPEAAYLTRLGEKIAGAAGLEGQCTFTLVNSDVVNAFAVPGCYIYLTRGLMALVTSEAELASVLAHEVGHVVGSHSRRQQRRSLWRTLGVFVVSLTGEERLTRLASEAAQYFTLRYSRAQEYESDDLGIRYLRAAGYDPFAAADMLGALGRQEAYLAQTGGRDAAQGIPEWARSHPLTESRIARARTTAAATGLADDALPEAEAAYLREVDGLLYGDDPEQGFVQGRRFAHPVMRIGFQAPPGFTLTNSPQAIRLAGPNGVRGEFGGGAMRGGGIEAYAEALAGRIVGGVQHEVGGARRVSINGLRAVVLEVRIATQNGTLPLAIAAYDGGGGQAYHFVMVSPPADGSARAIEALFASFHLLSDAEVAELKPRVVRVVTVAPATTVRALSRLMADDNGLPLFLTLNGRNAAQSLQPVERVKIITYAG